MKKYILFFTFFYYLAGYCQFGGPDPFDHCSVISNWKTMVDCELGIVYLKGYTQGFNFNTYNNTNPGVSCYVSTNPHIYIVNGQLSPPAISLSGQFAANGYYSMPLIKDDVERTYFFDVGYFFSLNDPGGCKKIFSITVPACKCGGSASAELTSIEEYLTISNTPFGNIEVPIICEPIVDGSKSTCDQNYFLSINQFNPYSWTNVGSPLFSGWVNGSAPNNIDLSQYAPLLPNTFYMLQFAIGPYWDAKYILFQKSSNSYPNCCLLNLYKDNETLTGYTEYIYRENIWACTVSIDSSDEVTIANNANILFRAGKQITLAEGFNTQNGSVFIAEIIPNPCNRNKSSEKNEKNIDLIKIYPNPTDNIINFEFDKNETGEIEIYSLDGKLILSKRFEELTLLSINISNYQKGIYIARISIDKKIITKKIMKE